MKKCPSCGEELSWETEFCPGCGAETDYFMRPAGFWIRVGAFLLDLVFLFIALYLVGKSVKLINADFVNSITYMIVGSLPGLLYKPLMESFCGATLGKMITKIRVLNGEGRKISLIAAFGRFLPFFLVNAAGLAMGFWMHSLPGYDPQDRAFFESLRMNPIYLVFIIIIFTTYFILFVDCLCAAFTQRKQALHDMIALSYCVYKPPAEKLRAMTDMAGPEGDGSQQEYSDYFKPEKDAEGE